MTVSSGNVVHALHALGLERKLDDGLDAWPLKSLIERMPVILWTVDKDLVLTSLQGFGLINAGLRPGQMIGKNINQFFQTNDFSAPPIWMHRRTLMGYTSIFEQNWNGHTYQVYLEALHDRVGRVTGCFGLGVETGTLQLTRATPPREIEEMSVLYRVAETATDAQTEDELIERVTRMIGEKLYPHHFGAILLDERTGGLSHHASFRRNQLRPSQTTIPLGTNLAGRVANDGKLVRIDDALKEHSPTGIYPGMRSAVCVPMRVGDHVIGVLEAESPQANTYDEADERLLTTFAGLLANAIEKSRLYQATSRRNAELEALRQAGLGLTSNLDIQSVLDAICANALNLVSGDRAHIFVNHSDQPVFASTLNAEADRHYPDIQEHVTNFVLEVEKKRGPLIVLDSSSHPVFTQSGWNGSIAGLPLSIGNQILGVMAVLFEKPHLFDDAELRVLTLLADQAAIALENARLYRDMEEGYLETVIALAKAMDARDSYTADHSQRLAEWAEGTAQAMGCSTEEIQAIRWGALLHDIGKIGIPDQILRKPGPLTIEEWDLMRQHPSIGAEIIRPVRRLANVIPIILSHQEHFDGTGYPNGLKSDTIPLGGRILAVVDAFGAITDDRVYRKARTTDEAVDELQRCSGSHFDPEIIDRFFAILNHPTMHAANQSN